MIALHSTHKPLNLAALDPFSKSAAKKAYQDERDLEHIAPVFERELLAYKQDGRYGVQACQLGQYEKQA